MYEPDKAQFTEWVRKYRSSLYRAAWALTGERSLAQDLVQETFALAWRARKQLINSDLVQAWLYRILKREAVKQWRQRRIYEPLDEAENEASFEDTTALEMQLDLVNALQELNDAHREILVLHYLSDLSYEQMSITLEIPIGTVMSRLNRARCALRQILKGENCHE